MQVYDQVTTVVAAGNDLGEGPLWDGRCNNLYWLDITGEQLHIQEWPGGGHRVLPLDCVPGSIHLTDDPSRLLLTSTRGLLEVDLSCGEVIAETVPIQLGDGLRFNDGKTDPAGNIWAGVMNFDCLPGQGSLHRITGREKSRRVFDGMTVPNGLAWSGDGQTFYHIDSPQRSVMAYRYERASGELSEPRVALSFPDDGSVPDGMCIDTEDNLWISFWGGSRVDCFNPGNGRRLGTVRLPVELVTSCCFGGESMSELYITSACFGLDEDRLSKFPASGALFKVDVRAVGVPEPVASL